MRTREDQPSFKQKVENRVENNTQNKAENRADGTNCTDCTNCNQTRSEMRLDNKMNKRNQ